MDQPGTVAPPVVGVMVVHEPGAWFDEVLYSLVHQDYPNLNLLFLVVGEAGTVPQRIKNQLPAAFVRSVPSNPGFGPAANEAMRLVEGSGLFLLMHDDITLDTVTVSSLVEEMYRSNAGVVGPKLVDWDEPAVLQHVGFGVDRFGELDPIVEPGELDQEQHDAVRDVFGLPSACVLIRADLFRSLGGFPAGYEFHGEDLDLCWRAHLSGARVIVAPSAVVRHRQRLSERVSGVAHRRMIARHRIDTIAALTGRWRIPGVLLQLAVVSIVETVVGVFTGRSRDGLASLYALIGLPARMPQILLRRRQIRVLREVPERDVAQMQMRGSARLALFVRQRRLRAESSRALVAVTHRPRRDGIAIGVWLSVIVVALFGSRGLIAGGVAEYGQLLDIPDGADLVRRYLAGWDASGFGRSGHPPTANLLMGLVELAPVPAGLTRTLLALGPIALGYWGSWRLAGFLPSNRARALGLATYAAIPLPYAALAAGRASVLATYAAFPWALDLIRRLSGIGVLNSVQSWGDDDIADAVVPVPVRARVQMTAVLGLLCAVVGAFVPAFPLLVAVAALFVAIGTIVARGSTTVFVGVASSIGAVVIAALLNLPWIAAQVRVGGWSDLIGATDLPEQLGVRRVASFGIGAGTLSIASLGLYLALAAGPLIGRGWRLTWSARAGAMAGGFLVLAVLGDRGSLSIAMPEVGLLLVPVACGLALGAACVMAAFEHDIAGARLGWRQPLGLLVGAGVLVGLTPGLAGSFQGSWSAPQLTLATLLRQLQPAGASSDATAPAVGDYRVLFLGDERLMPVPGRTLYPGVAYAVTDDGPIGVEARWRAEEGDGDRVLRESLDALASVSTARVGRLFGTLGIRYIVVPVDDGVARFGPPVVVPGGVRQALSAQLDLRIINSPNQVLIYENTAWIPTRSVLDAVASTSSREAGAAAIVTGALGGGMPILASEDAAARGEATLPAGTVNLAFGEPDSWRVTVGGAEVPGRTAFGWASGFDAAGGLTVIELRPVDGRRMLLVVQGALWVLTIFAAFGGARAYRRRRAAAAAPVIDFDELANPTPPEAFDGLNGHIHVPPVVGAVGESAPLRSAAGGPDGGVE